MIRTYLTKLSLFTLGTLMLTAYLFAGAWVARNAAPEMETAAFAFTAFLAFIGLAACFVLCAMAASIQPKTGAGK